MEGPRILPAHAHHLVLQLVFVWSARCCRPYSPGLAVDLNMQSSPFCTKPAHWLASQLCGWETDTLRNVAALPALNPMRVADQGLINKVKEKVTSYKVTACAAWPWKLPSLPTLPQEFRAGFWAGVVMGIRCSFVVLRTAVMWAPRPKLRARMSCRSPARARVALAGAL